MPRVLEFKGYIIYIYFKDHGAAHVHVKGHGKSVKIDIATRKVSANRGFNKTEIGFLVAFVAKNAEDLERIYDEIQKK